MTSPILLCTMGKTWQVLPEAFLYKPETFTEVHCLTTSSHEVNPQSAIEFFRGYPRVRFTVSRLVNFTDLQTKEDHQRFEEALFRWYLQHLQTAQQLPFVCLTGGYKSIGAAVQKAAGLFGATEIFHVLAKPEPQTVEQIEKAVAEGTLNFISLGPEAGWSRLRTLDPNRFLLRRLSTDDGSLINVTVDDFTLSNLIHESLDLISRRAEAWDRVPDLPFASLALWKPRDADWLRAPLDPDADAGWVRLLPKIKPRIFSARSSNAVSAWRCALLPITRSEDLHR